MKRLVFLLALALLCTSPHAGADAYLLGSPQVRKELRISHSLALRIVHNLNEAARLNRGGTMSMEEARQLEAERKRTPPGSLESQAMSWLSPAQKQRLEQIERQRSGAFLFEDWRFAQRVGLSHQQHKKLLTVFDKAFQRSVREQQKLSKSNISWYGHLDRKRFASKYAAYYQAFDRIGIRWQETVESALGHSLTKEQKAKWRAILGKPFRAHLTYDTKSYPMD